VDHSQKISIFPGKYPKNFDFPSKLTKIFEFLYAKISE